MTTIQKALLIVIMILSVLASSVFANYVVKKERKVSRDREKKHTDRVLEQLAILAEKERDDKWGVSDE